MRSFSVGFVAKDALNPAFVAVQNSLPPQARTATKSGPPLPTQMPFDCARPWDLVIDGSRKIVYKILKKSSSRAHLPGTM
jgi:hypothetical protein